MAFRVKNDFWVLSLIITADRDNIYNKEHHGKQVKIMSSVWDIY